MELVRVTNLAIKLYNLDDLDKVFEKIEKINEKAVSRKSSTGISVAVEVDLLENCKKQDSAQYSKCSCKYAVRPGDKSVPRPPH